MTAAEPPPNPQSAVAAAYERVRLARGVVGKASTVAIAAVAALGAVAWSLRDPLYLIIVAALIVCVFAIYFGGTLWFANKHPGVSLLEGAELIRWREMEMSSKSMGHISGEQQTEPLLPPAKEI